MRRWMRLGALVAAALGAGCESERTIDVGALSATPGLLAFGSVDVGLSASLRVSVTNESRGAVGVPTLQLAADPNQELALSGLTTDCKDAPRPASQTLAAGECARFTVTWTPSGAHPAVGAVEIDPSNSNDPIVLPVTGLAVSTILPALRLCALDESGAVVDSGCSSLGANPPVIPTVDFGDAVIGTAAVRTVRLFNEGEAPLTFSPQPALAGTTPPQISLTGSVAGGALAPGASSDLLLTGTPTALGTLAGELDLSTNDPRLGFVPVPLVLAATGIAICVAPAVQLSFGQLLLGTSAVQPFALTNCGEADVAFSQDSFSPIAPTSTQFSIGAAVAPAPGTILHPNDQLASAVTYAPSAAESDLATLEVTFSNSYGSYVSHVGLSGSGLTTFCGTPVEPTPVANIAASYSTEVNGTYLPFDPNATPSPVQPLDFVQLDGSASTGASPATYHWKLLSQPAGSTTTLEGTGSLISMQALVSGDYVVQLTVADSSGCAGTSEVTVQVIPTGDVHIELTWAESCGDVDLHYVGPGGVLCDGSDTAYYNTNPDWGCATLNCGHEEDPGGIYPDGTRVDDATLDHDDQWGFGPENVTQQKPFDSPAGSPYQIWVHYFSPVPDGGGGSGRCGTVHPTINVYIGGVLTHTFTLSAGLDSHQVWNAAALSISNQGATIQVIPGDTSEQQSSQCNSANRARGPGLKQAR